MRFPRNTLLGRTALYLGALLFLVQALWFATAQYLIQTQVKPAYEQQIVDLVSLAQALVESQVSESGGAGASSLRLPPFDTVEILPDSAPRPELAIHDSDDVPGDLSENLKRRFGPEALSLKQRDADVSWLRFPARGRLYWLKLTLSSTRTLSYAKLFFVSLELALAVGGAYLIVFRLTKKLRYVTSAAKAIGQGEPPAVLETSGPEEIRSLCEGFNQMSRDLIKLEADRRLMLAGISHDLRTPLTRLRIAVELADARSDPSMVRDIEDMDAILRQFLDYAREGDEEAPAEHDLDALVRDARERYAARGERVEAEPGGVPPFPFRRNAVRRALDNLIDNALRYGKSDVRIATRCEGAVASVSVSDKGPGIRSGEPADYIKPFAREETARSELRTGLGLTIVDRIARFHGGRLRLENAKEGGLVATLELPLDVSKRSKR